MLKLGGVLGADYAITGGFFMFSQILFLGLTFPDFSVLELNALGAGTTTHLKDMPAELRPALVSLFVALALLSVFFFGLLLDLVAPFFVFGEMELFRRYAYHHRSWLQPLADRQLNEYLGDDLNYLLKLAPRRKIEKGDLLYPVALWRKSVRRKRRVEFFRTRSLLKAFQRTQQVVVLYAMGYEHDILFDVLQEKIRLSRLSRSISLSIYIILIEFAFYNIFYAYDKTFINTIYSLLVITTLSVLTAIFSSRAYDGLCIELFAATYLRMKSESKSIGDPPAPSKLPATEMSGPDEVA